MRALRLYSRIVSWHKITVYLISMSGDKSGVDMEVLHKPSHFDSK